MVTIKHPATAGQPGKVLVVEYAHDVAHALCRQLTATRFAGTPTGVREAMRPGVARSTGATPMIAALEKP